MSFRRFFLRHLAPMLAAVLVLALTGPYGTFHLLGFWDRLAYWALLLGIGTLLFEGLIRLGLRLAWGRRHWPLVLAAAVLTGAAPLTACVGWVNRWFGLSTQAAAIGWGELYLYVVALTLPLCAAPLWLELQRRRALVGSEGVGEPVAAAPPPTLGPAAGLTPARWRRLPEVAPQDLMALETEDHYVRAHHVGGSTLILCRMADAQAELAAWPGRRVHRSWWVADAAVTRCDRLNDGRALLTLSTGATVPVSRSYVAAVRAAYGDRVAQS